MNLPDFLIDHPDGEIRLTGHRIGLFTVVREYKEGHSAEEIAEEYPTLPLELVRQVIAFYLDNVDEVDAYVGACRVELERQASAPTGPGTLEIRRLMDIIHQADARNRDDATWARLSLSEKIELLGLMNHKGNK